MPNVIRSPCAHGFNVSTLKNSRIAEASEGSLRLMYFFTAAATLEFSDALAFPGSGCTRTSPELLIERSCCAVGEAGIFSAKLSGFADEVFPRNGTPPLGVSTGLGSSRKSASGVWPWDVVKKT